MNETNNRKIGSVLVVGSGIAGMQAALDCANAGLKVYLVESRSSIGGNMARLDKTFPTNDCAMCMISPKLVEVGRHLNIKILSYSELKGVEGEAGHYKISVNRRARLVDEELCNGCGDCERECPVNVVDSFNGELAEHRAIYRMYPQAIPNVYTVMKTERPSPCKATCPAGTNAHGYVALIAKGKFLKALDVVRDRMPFASICGRICFHPCEDVCNRGKIDEPVSIRNLKRFVADYEWNLMQKGESIERPPDEKPIEIKQDYKEKVAVIGGGPAGLTCAYNLVKRGYAVTVFDANEKLGGMMRTGIPPYRLSREFLDFELDLIVKHGIEVKSGVTIGTDIQFNELKEMGFDAICVATGAQLARKLPLEGSDAEGVLHSIPFLAQTNAGKKPKIGKKIIVVGGGNTALDVARSALRIVEDGEVCITSRKTREKMNAHDWEIQEAIDEGIEIHNSWGPRTILTQDGKVTGMEIIKSIPAYNNQKGFNPKYDKDNARILEADTVILAVGQACDFSFLDESVAIKDGVIDADPLTLETSAKGVFAGGDNVTGPRSLVVAVSQGHRAAESIHRYLRGMDLRKDRESVEPATQFAGLRENSNPLNIPRHLMPTIGPSIRSKSFVEMETGFTAEMAVKEAGRCVNCAICSECMECVRVCKARAVNHEMRDELIHFEVGAIVLANGYEPFDAGRKPEFGYGRYKNVVTSVQFERILSASGPYSGHIKRPGDGRVPKKIAWIQCVGSRDVPEGNDYCSSVCCMYATKQSIIAREHESDLETTIFFIDMRSFGKGFESFFNRAKNENGTRFVRSQISSIKENPENENLILQYVDTRNSRSVIREEFDLVVLSVGLVADESIKSIAELAGIQCNQFSFAGAHAWLPLLSSREGIFLSGAVSGPKDIPETVMQSSAAAALCGELLQEVRGSEIEVRKFPPERDVSSEEPRIGVFVCHCGVNIASVVNVEEVVAYAQKIPGVAYAENTLYACSQDTQKKIRETIVEKRLNRLVIASCTPRTHESLFQETLREAGLNKYLFEMADIREQCSWVHQGEPEKATEKAKDLVRGSIGKSQLLEPIHFKTVGITKSVLVIGGGISGMNTALSLSRQGIEVFLVEKKERLGGELSHIKSSLEGYDWQTRLSETIASVESQDNITVFLNSELERINGFLGNFTSVVKGESTSEIHHGAVVIATGAGQLTPDNFLYGVHSNVITQRELETQLKNGLTGKHIVMIQCIGSRNEDRPYCSRVCCGEAVKNALAIKERDPRATVSILYREMRTYAYKEIYYRKAREKGVRFIHFADDRYPEVSAINGSLEVRVHNTVLDKELTLSADTLVLSSAIVPDGPNNRHIGELLKVPLNEDGFFMEAHVKLRPVDFANEGIFVCGLAHSPKFTEENVTQALAVAGRVACLLSRDTLEVGGLISVVDPDKCAACLTCIRECIYEAPFINPDGVAEIEAVKCQGCGNCASACPAKAIQLRTFTDNQEKALFFSILKEQEMETEGTR